LTGLKKNLDYSAKEKCNIVEKTNKKISVSRQCDLLGLRRSTFYYKSQRDNNYDELLMQLIDKEFTKHPFYGIRRITAWLRTQGHQVNHKRVSRLMKEMGLLAIYPKRNLSLNRSEFKKYPYLLRDMEIDRPNHVWSTDITYIRLSKGFIYLTAIMDWYSRYVLSWKFSTTLDAEFCLMALEEALKVGKPEIFNSDQGVQFTSVTFTSRLEKSEIQISMDGKGRALDNVFVERLWRSLKYERVYLSDYSSVLEAKQSIDEYFKFYNEERLHQSLGYQTPKSIYERKEVNLIKYSRYCGSKSFNLRMASLNN
jgi:putative transposase